jgi:hypothetical protein
VSGADGVCLSVCVPQVSQYESLLPQDICAPDERCAPCINPLTQQPSGACLIGTPAAFCGGPASGAGASDAGPAAPAACPHTGAPVLDPTTAKLTSCDPNGGAHCLQKSLVPAAMQSELADCPNAADGMCVPDVFIESGGNFISPTCTSIFGAEGRCLDEVIPQVAAQLSQLPQATCATYERCVPCTNPLDGTTTGACALSCDPGPTTPPITLQACCDQNGASAGLCIPKTSIPTAEQPNLGQDVCTDAATLCVPKEMTNQSTFKPPTCTGQGLIGIFTGSYTGVCLSKCLSYSFIQSLGISQGSCDAEHDCAPCTNPITKAPTGAPGCP